MWQGSDQDPGGGGPSEADSPESSQELCDLKDQFEQQQVLIAQLKEVIRKSDQSHVTQEKVDEYMNSLSRRSAKVKKTKNNTDRKSSDIPANQKISLLRQQVEETKLKMAERGKSQKGMEEMVTQLKAQLDDSQNLISQTSFSTLSTTTHEKLEYSENSSSPELYSILINKEKRITDLLGKVQKLEANVLDLRENLKEKDSIIDARTQAITLMTESLSRKGKNTIDALDETRDEMRKMQQNFVIIESEMKARQVKLLEDLKLKNYEIAELQETNSQLLNEKVELENENCKLKEKLENTDDGEELNTLRNRIQELEELLKKSTDQSSGKTSGRKNKEKSTPTKDNSQNDEISKLQAKVEQLQAENQQFSAKIEEYETRIQELNIRIEDLQKLPQSLETGTDPEECSKLKKQLEDSNKNMIKVKAQHKSKVKQLTKQIDDFKKVSDANAEIVKLEGEKCKLEQKIAELEEEKGSLQLKLVDSESPKGSEAAEPTHVEFEEKIQEYQRELEEKDKIISILEQEITSLKKHIESLNENLSNLSHLENTTITSEITTIQLEERLDSLEQEKQKILDENSMILCEKNELIERIDNIMKEKQETSFKLDHYIQENIELVDKLEKLSAEKVSSAESIEIVEGLTQQEKLELEAYQKTFAPEESVPQAVDLNESVNELKEETSELLQKIELFTVERREVMEKMELLKQENSNLLLKIKEIENNRDVLEETYEQLQTEKDALDKENDCLKQKLEKIPDSENDATKLEIEALKHELEDKKIECQNMGELIEDLQQKSQERDTQNIEFSNTLIDLKRTLTELETENHLLQNRVTELDSYNANLNEIIEKHKEELETVSNSDWENRRLLENKDNEIAKIIKERDNNQNVIESLQQSIKDKDESFQKLSNTLKQKYLELQKQLEENSGTLENIQKPLELKVEELTNKNKEQFEKMKKIAANLKKKTQLYQELDEKYKSEQEKLKTLIQQLQDLELELANSRQENVTLQNTVTDLRIKLDKVSEISLQQELLQTQGNFTKPQISNNEETLNAKIQELEIFIETQENNLRKHIERVGLLEEEKLHDEETRRHLSKQADEFHRQLQEKSSFCDEILKDQEALGDKLTELTNQNVNLRNKLQESDIEHQALVQQMKNTTEKNEKLKKKLLITLEKVKEFESNQIAASELESENSHLKKTVQNLETELKTFQTDYERIIEENKDVDRINNEWQMKCDELIKAKNELLAKNEEFIKEITEKEAELQEYILKEENLRKSLVLKEEETLQQKNPSQQLNLMGSSECTAISSFFNEPTVETATPNVLSSFFDQPPRNQREAPPETANISQLRSQLDDLQITHNHTLRRLDEMENSRYRVEAELENLTVENNELRKSLEAQSDSLFFDLSQRQQQLEELQYEKERLEDELQSVRNQLKSALDDVEELKMQLQEFEVKKTAEDTVQSVVVEAQTKLQETPEIAKQFVWGDQTDDPFSFVSTQQETEIVPEKQETVKSQLQPQQQPIDDLLNKIKTLEFMLFNTEKEKDEALLQCHQLSEELAKLLYSRENSRNPNTSNLETQILTDSQIGANTTPSLQQLEFEPVSLPPGTEEPVMSSKNAYVCGVGNADNVEAEILQPSEISVGPGELEAIEFEPTRKPLEGSAEDKFIETEAYVCGTGRDTFGENDDGWGWGPDEAKLEEEHAKKLETTTQKEELVIFKEKLKVLELERENHLEEIKQLQIKSGKLIKKLKEFKAKNEALVKKQENAGAADFFDLNDTIQEELKLQIQQTEKKLKEISDELEKEKKEKTNMLKRIDVLTAANERMVEMKEKQDVEMMGWQRTTRDLKEKLQQLEWGDDSSFDTSKEPPIQTIETTAENSGELAQKIQELNETIKDLTLDNEELQSLLEEQRALRIAAEKSKSMEPIAQNTISESEYIKITKERDSLADNYRLSVDEKKKLQDQVNDLIKNNSELREKFADIEKSNEDLANLIVSKDQVISLLEAEKVQQNSIVEITNEKDVLFRELQEKNAQIESLRETMNNEIDSLRTELATQAKTAEMLLTENHKKDADLQRISEEFSLKEKEFSSNVEHLNQQWQLQVDQRGTEIAESWKLHLETRETEFGQLESTLRKELNELEEKCNGLVNENNELRKNVDAEIRNEVDRISHLQQQISERQQMVNELTQQLQEKIREVETLNDELTTLKTEFEEEKSIVDEIFQKLQEISGDGNILREKHNILNVFNRFILQIQASETETTILKQQVENLNQDLGKAVVNSDNLEVQLKHTNDTLRATIEERNSTIEDLNQLLHQNQTLKDYENENINNLQHNIVELQQVNQQLTVEISGLNSVINEKNQGIVELQQINQQLQLQVEETKNYEMQINNLKLQLEEKDREHGLALENLSQESSTSFTEQSKDIETLKRRLLENENRYEELLTEKDAIVEALKMQLTQSDRTNEVNDLTSQLSSKWQECGELQNQIAQQNSLITEDEQQLTELRAIIQEQVLKIEQLKNELFHKSNDYDSLIAQMDISNHSQNKSTDEDAEKSNATSTRQAPPEEDDLSEPVSRAELDLALYMLHQRDVRCEELTMELTQLLEERDTLQLRLSNALREKEEISRHNNPPTEASGAIPKTPTTSSLMDVEARQNPHQLENKLSELKSVGYKRDKTLVDEQELRRFQQLSFLQQHKDDASRLPPEAAARLVDASYTLSRDVQSPSKVLLNWLWGKSTPRVNNI